jgi:mono/diheme cytochrome c family protein
MAGSADAGEELFEQQCQSCHGENGDGNGPIAETMILKPRDFALAAFKFDTDADWQSGTDTDLRDVIKQGPGAYGGSAMMPAFSHFEDDQVADLIEFIRSLARSGS